MSTAIHTLGIDLGKNTFHLVGLDLHGKPVLRRKLSRRQLAEFMANLPLCLVLQKSATSGTAISAAPELRSDPLKV